LENRETIETYILQILEELNLDLVEFDLFRAGNRKILRIFVDRKDGVSVDDCASVSRKLGARLDLEEDLIPGQYTLEVSSPGVDRPLKTQRDFERQNGRFIRVTLQEKIEGHTFWTGTVLEANEQSVLLDAGEKQITIPYDMVLSAKVEIQF